MMNSIQNIEELIEEIIDCVKEVRNTFSAGYLESVYSKALCIELKNRGIAFESEVLLPVSYKGYSVGEFRADIVVDKRVIIELKATQNLTIAHELQLVNYLTTTGIEHGLLINFGSDRIEIKRKFRTYRKSKQV